MKTFHVWKHNEKAVGPTGPWEFLCSVLARDESHAMEIGKMRGGMNGKYKAYEGF